MAGRGRRLGARRPAPDAVGAPRCRRARCPPSRPTAGRARPVALRRRPGAARDARRLGKSRGPRDRGAVGARPVHGGVHAPRQPRVRRLARGEGCLRGADRRPGAGPAHRGPRGERRPGWGDRGGRQADRPRPARRVGARPADGAPRRGGRSCRRGAPVPIMRRGPGARARRRPAGRDDRSIRSHPRRAGAGGFAIPLEPPPIRRQGRRSTPFACRSSGGM